MTPELEKTLAELLEKFGIVFDKSVGFTTQTIMPYLKELLARMRTYYVISDTITLVVSLVCLILLALLFVKIFKDYFSCVSWRGLLA